MRKTDWKFLAKYRLTALRKHEIKAKAAKREIKDLKSQLKTVDDALEMLCERGWLSAQRKL